jgi:hypothetical protein
MSVKENLQRSTPQKPNFSPRPWAWVGSACLVLMTAVLVMSGCATKVFYTQEYRELVDSAHLDPSRLQFYNDKEFLIRRRVETKEVTTQEGVVSLTDGLRVQDVRVRRGTPCRVDSVSGNFYFVRFEIGEGNVVKFYKNAYDHYQIGAEKWVRGRGNILYGGKECQIERNGNDCLLLVKNYQTFRDKKQKDVAEGLRYNTDIIDTLDTGEEDE